MNTTRDLIPASRSLPAASRRPFERGVAAVEFAIVLVPLLIIAFGAAEYGRAIYQFNTLVKSVRGAVRMVAQRLARGLRCGAFNLRRKASRHPKLRANGVKSLGQQAIGIADCFHRTGLTR